MDTDETKIELTPEQEAEKAAEQARIDAIKNNKDIPDDEKEILLSALTPQVPKEKQPETLPAVEATPSLTPEDENLLSIARSIVSDPNRANYFTALTEGNIEDIILSLIPKGEDYSKLSDKAIFQRSLELQGYEGDDLTKQMDLYNDFSSSAKEREVKKAKKFLDENGQGNIPVELQKRINKIADAKKQRELGEAQYNSDTYHQIENKVNTLIDKNFNGYTIKKEDKKDLMDLITYCTIPDPKTRKYNVTKAFDIATKAFTFDKVIKEKDAELTKTKDLLTKTQAVIRKHVNVSANPITNTPAGGTSVKKQKMKKMVALDGTEFEVPDYTL